MRVEKYMKEYKNIDAFIHELDLHVATVGLGYPGSNVHVPNENIRLDL